MKEETHIECKNYRNLFPALMKKVNRLINNINNTWKWIKSLIFTKAVASSALMALSIDNGNTTSNPYDLANTFNNYFASLKNECNSAMFLQPTSIEEIANITPSLDSNKASDPNSIYLIEHYLLLKKKFQSNRNILSIFFCDWYFSITTQNCNVNHISWQR